MYLVSSLVNLIMRRFATVPIYMIVCFCGVGGVNFYTAGTAAHRSRVTSYLHHIPTFRDVTTRLHRRTADTAAHRRSREQHSGATRDDVTWQLLPEWCKIIRVRTTSSSQYSLGCCRRTIC